MHLCGNLLVGQDVVLVQLHLGCTTCPVEDRCCAIGRTVHHVDAAQLEHHHVQPVEAAGHCVDLPQLVCSTANAVMEAC